MKIHNRFSSKKKLQNKLRANRAVRKARTKTDIQKATTQLCSFLYISVYTLKTAVCTVQILTCKQSGLNFSALVYKKMFYLNRRR
jgi:hypothetical protein